MKAKKINKSDFENDISIRGSWLCMVLKVDARGEKIARALTAQICNWLREFFALTWWIPAEAVINKSVFFYVAVTDMQLTLSI